MILQNADQPPTSDPNLKPRDLRRYRHWPYKGHLGFNKSLDSRLPKIRSFDLDAFEQQILDAFHEYPSEKLDALYDMKQRVIECIIACDPPGGNTFKLPHRSASDKN